MPDFLVYVFKTRDSTILMQNWPASEKSLSSEAGETAREPWFQQDGATCRTALATIDLLKYTFGDRLISRFGPVNWPPRSCDLTPLD
ncbi:uncharacterized protein TNCV_556581 [Trichonephila clavipes]|uniref:Uncharacterized protein n=1 Tax=Trichonephila clavipes TaxID=2585209 RepID=A0A8X6V2U1_TRICX|nr:uncharacterized protein TNCV_556581 [Trichonephila clavipes]